jgi:hypothetical protein
VLGGGEDFFGGGLAFFFRENYRETFYAPKYIFE